VTVRSLCLILLATVLCGFASPFAAQPTFAPRPDHTIRWRDSRPLGTPSAGRIGIGDLSRRQGGYFGPKHATHQNGLDVDVYYPRRDHRERPPRRVSQIDLRLAQDLVDRFLAVGADVIYVGPNTPLTGPPGIVVPLWNHDNHLHVRIRFPARGGGNG
jgi:Penicillin-insensitive murein endopeptidase